MKWSSPHTTHTRVQNAVLGCNLKNDRMILVCFQGKPFSITVIPNTNAKKAEVDWFYEDLQDLDYCDIEWFALETNRDHSVIFEIASKYCILNSFVLYEGYSISSKGFLPAVVDVMVI